MRTVRLVVLVASLAIALQVARGVAQAADSAGIPVFDTTPPHDVHGAASRPPDHGGWYTHDVTFQFDGSDDESGIAECDRVTYAGPDGDDAAVSGECRDNAGNSTKATERIEYDSTDPVVNGAA